jgi:mono/diheme cytochrome c family protein
MRWIDFESGAYERAARWLNEADLDHVNEENTLSAAATAFAFAGDPIRAESLFRRSDAIISASTRMYDLGERLVIDPDDKQAADDLKRLSAAPIAVLDDDIASSTEQTTKDGPIENLDSSGTELFARYCSACHGASGDGNGRAARHLFPRPRDFRTDRFRLVSTRNGVPTQDDLEAVIERGMPGTSMRSYEELSEDERKLLAQEVLRQHREGIRDQFIAMLGREGEEADEAEVREVVEDCTNPGEVIKPPKIGPPDSQSVARGKRMYIELGCNKCHGDDGIGATDMFLVDDKRLAARPRDLLHEPFKGGSEPESIYLRIAVGMPGSPHPAAGNLTQQQLIDVVQYCRSLSEEPKRLLTNHQQAILATSRAYRAALGGSGKVE